MAPGISVVIPTYNCAEFLPECLESVRRQNIQVREVIIVDDGSRDDTEAVVKKLGSDIIYIYQENLGPGAARNKGVLRAKSEWIAFVDADDLWTENKLTLQLQAVERYPQLRLIAGDMAETDERANIVTSSMLEHHGQRAFFSQLSGAPLDNACALLIHKNFIPTGTVLAHRESLIDAGLFPNHIRFSEDLALWIQFAAKFAITCIPDVLMLRRRHGTNATGANENMLEGLVQTMTLLDEVCADSLHSQGVSSKERLAQHQFDLGYWRFHHGKKLEAYAEFKNAWKYRKNFKTAAYVVLSGLSGRIG